MRYIYIKYRNNEYNLDDYDLDEINRDKDRLEQQKLQSLRDGGDDFALGQESVNMSLYSSELPSSRFYRRRN
ncbi:MAG: hypothetical protein LUD27_04760 [Clostridia bacterium]|nr:hypothetical protein [Clostridia bacterium]